MNNIQDNSIQYFIGKTHKDSMVKNAVYCFMYNKEKSHILVINFKVQQNYQFIIPGGSIHEEETRKQALQRKIMNDTDITSFTIISDPIKIQSNYFIKKKGELENFWRSNNAYIVKGIIEDKNYHSKKTKRLPLQEFKDLINTTQHNITGNIYNILQQHIV